MYNEYSPILNSMKQRMLHISKYRSENIIATLLRDICDSGKCGRISFEFNYPLSKFIHIESLSDIDDKLFAENINTHCDFVIYNKINKEVRLAVEVDGKQHESPVQKRCDERKDRILSWANIPVLRLKTTDVDCENKIRQALEI